jgi:heat shock protein 5
MASSLSLLLFAFIALICFCPVSIKADEANGNKKLEYGTVIGIGESPNFLLAGNEPNLLLQIWVQRMHY